MADQFISRDLWIGIKSDFDRVLGKNKSNDVYLSKDGYLIQPFNKPTDEGFKSKIEEINSMFAAMPEGKKYFLLAPTSVEIIGDKLPMHAITDDEKEYMSKVKASIDKRITFVDVYDKLYSKKNDYIYYKTDHHWTTKGAYFAYEVLAENMNLTKEPESSFDIQVATRDFYGSLYSKSGFKHLAADSISLYVPKKKEKISVNFVDENKVSNSVFNMNELNKKDKYAVFLGGNHGLIKITTNATSLRKLLLVKDSYANNLIPFLTGQYSEIYVVDPRYYSEELKELVNHNQINEMLVLYNINTFLSNKF